MEWITIGTNRTNYFRVVFHRGLVYYIGLTRHSRHSRVPYNNNACGLSMTKRYAQCVSFMSRLLTLGYSRNETPSHYIDCQRFPLSRVWGRFKNYITQPEGGKFFMNDQLHSKLRPHNTAQSVVSARPAPSNKSYHDTQTQYACMYISNKKRTHLHMNAMYRACGFNQTNRLICT